MNWVMYNPQGKKILSDSSRYVVIAKFLELKGIDKIRPFLTTLEEQVNQLWRYNMGIGYTLIEE